LSVPKPFEAAAGALRETLHVAGNAEAEIFVNGREIDALRRQCMAARAAVVGICR
jgi:hypothetical protein